MTAGDIHITRLSFKYRSIVNTKYMTNLRIFGKFIEVSSIWSLGILI
jgi:hypothetical protein